MVFGLLFQMSALLQKSVHFSSFGMDNSVNFPNFLIQNRFFCKEISLSLALVFLVFQNLATFSNQRCSSEFCNITRKVVEHLRTTASDKTNEIPMYETFA